MATNQTPLWEEIWKRTPNTKHFHLADGSKQAVIFSTPVHFEDENGMYANIDTALHDEADFDTVDFPVSKHGKDEFKAARERAKAEKKSGKLNRDNHDFQGLKVPFFAKLPRNWKRGYSIGRGQDKLTFKPVGASPSKGYVTEGKDNEIVYQDAWNDVDVALELTDRGVKETLTLKTDKAPTTFSFEIGGALADDLSSGELKIQPAWLEDSSGTKRDVAQTIRVEDNKTFLDLAADVSGLTYPVMIDPTVTIQPAAQDATIFGGNINANGGTRASLECRGMDYEALIQFNLNSVPAGVPITGGIITLTGTGEDTASPTTVNVHKLTASWNESTVTYANKPTFESTPIITLSSVRSASGAVYSFDIKSLIDFWVANPTLNYGMYWKETGGNGRYWASSNYNTTSYRPKVTVTYNQPPTAPTVTAPNGGETWNAQHTITWNPANDVSNIVTIVPVSSNLNGIIPGDATKPAGMTFKKLGGGYITKIGMYTASGTPGPKTIRLTDGNPLGTGTVYASGTINLTATATLLEYTLPTPVFIADGQTMAVELQNPSGAYIYTTSDGNVYGDGAPYWSGTANAGGDVYIKVTVEEATAQSQLKYHLQKSTDNGATWSDIALTNAGVASYTYDFSNVPQTSTAKIRIRAYDGTSYGTWDESNGVFTIQHNAAPTAPTNLSPSSGVKDRAAVTRLSWQHNDPNAPDPQSKFDLQWRQVGSPTWNTISQDTTNQFWDAPVGTFPHGNIEWQVRTYDQAGLSSAYSTQSIFLAGNKPTSPTITAPTGTVAVSRPTVQWSSPNQVAYQVQALDSSLVLWDNGEKVSTNKAQTIGTDLANGLNGSVKVRIKNADDLWSDWAISSISVSYTPPVIPTFSVTAKESYIEVGINNPTPSVTQPIVSFNDLYRRKSGESAWTRIATGIPSNGLYRDYAVASRVTYEYYVRAQGENGTFIDSLRVYSSLVLSGVWLHDVADPEGTAHSFSYNSKRDSKWQADVTLMQYAGRKRPVAEFGDMDEGRVSVQLDLSSGSDDLEKLQELIYSKATVCYRDNRGRKVYGVITSLPTADEVYGNSVTIEVLEIDYSEEV
jgi:hypothetical protein